MLRYILTAYWIILAACSIAFAATMPFGHMSNPTCKIESLSYWDAVFPARILGCGLAKGFREVNKVMSKEIYKF